MPSLLAQQVGYSAARLFVVSSAAVRRHGSGRASQSHPYVRQQGRAGSNSWDELRGCLWSALRPSADTARARRSQSHPCVRQQGRAGSDGWDELRGCLWSAVRPSADTARARPLVSGSRAEQVPTAGVGRQGSCPVCPSVCLSPVSGSSYTMAWV